MALTAKEKQFCLEFVANGYNGFRAYKEAYRCNDATANARASVLLKKEDVRLYIGELQKDRIDAQFVSADRVLEALCSVAFGEEASDKDRLRAIELIQKQLGFVTQRIEADVNGQVIFVDDLND